MKPPPGIKTGSKELKSVTFRIPDEYYKRLVREAKKWKEKNSTASFVQDAMMWYLDEFCTSQTNTKSQDIEGE